MPFVRKTDSQDSRHPIGTRKHFIGRTGELLFFVQNILKPEEPTHNIISIWGQGGVGKSTLLARFIDEAHSADFKDYCLTALVDERQTTPLSIMEKFADQLHMKGEFEKALKHYKEALRKLQTERETMQDAVLNRVPDFAGAAAEMVPVVGPLLREGAKASAGLYLDKRQKVQGYRDAEILEDPINELTRAFVNELNQLAESQVLLGPKRVKNLRLILFFDTFEQLATEAAPWLLNYFLPADIKGNIVLVIAGRDPIERSIPEDTKYWLPYCDNEIIYWISLNSFTEDETRTYLTKRKIIDPERIATIWQLSQGLPLYLGLLTSNPDGKVDPTADVVSNFLRWIPKEEQTKRQLALDASLFSRPFNQDDLAAFTYLPEHELPSLYIWLIAQPFVRSQDGRYLYHDVARDLFSRHLYQLSQKHYNEIRRVLAAYYQELFEKIQTEQGKEAYRSEEWLELLLAAISQLLLLPDQASHIKAIARILYAFQHTNKEQEREIGRSLRDLSQEPSSHLISPAARSVAMQLFHYVEDFDDTNQLKCQEWLEATDALLKSVIHLHSFSSELLAFIYYMRGRAYRVVGKKELAFQNFQQALKLEDPTNYAQQGWVHFYSQNYQEALAFQNRALERNPRDENAYIGRGWAYTNLGDYELAIADFDHARELDPNKNPGGRENGLRWAYYSSGKYQQALSVNNYFLERDPSDSKPYLFRSWCFRSLKDYSQSFDACNKALELDPNNAEVYVELGWAYFYSRDFPEALTYHKQALEQNPQDVDAYCGRGWAYTNLGDYELAIADFEHVLELAPNFNNPGGLYNGLRWAYYGTGKYQQAISVNDHLLERDPEECYVFRSRCFRSLKDYSQSFDACNKALELDPNNADAYFQRGLTYLWLKELGQAQLDFTRSCELKPTKIDIVLLVEWVGMCQGATDLLVSERLEAIASVDPQDYTAHICLAIALLLRRNLRGALSELEHALLPTRHEEWKAHFWKGMICAFLGQDEEAIAAIEQSLKLELPPILLTPLRWFEQDRPEFYQKYVVPLMARYDLV